MDTWGLGQTPGAGRAVASLPAAAVAARAAETPWGRRRPWVAAPVVAAEEAAVAKPWPLPWVRAGTSGRRR